MAQVEAEQIRHDFDEYNVMPAGTAFDEFVTIATDPYEVCAGWLAGWLAWATDWRRAWLARTPSP